MSISMSDSTTPAPRTFQRPQPQVASSYVNPVYGGSAPDPFVLKHCGAYWLYVTGFSHDGRAFGIFRSDNLVEWEAIGGALEPLPGGFGCYWAPEVTYYEGKFLMYY